MTNHLLINGEVLTQSPSAKGFHQFILPPEEGSWKAGIGIFFGTALTIGVASKDSALGYLAVSALDYVLQQSLGFEVDFDETFGPQIERAREQQQIPQKIDAERFDSLIEKVEPGLRQCHRPIVFSETATNAQVTWRLPRQAGILDGFFDSETYEYVSQTLRQEDLEDFQGNISSYNVNTFKGRVYIKSMQRTLPFEIAPEARSPSALRAIVGSLYENSSNEHLFSADVVLRGFRNESVNGRLKSIYAVLINPEDALLA
nr:hypothetical protein [Ruegeria meonggei]